MNAFDHLRRASELITTAGQVNRAALAEAAGHFWSATFDEEHWPLALRVDSTSLKAKLLAEGSIPATIQSLEAEQLVPLAEELARFCFNALDELTRFNLVPEPCVSSPAITGEAFKTAS